MGLVAVTIAAAVVAFGAFLPGYGIGSMNGVQNFNGFLEYFDLHATELNATEGNSTCSHSSTLDDQTQFILSIIFSITNLGGAVGIFFSGKPSDYFGRKTILLLAGMLVCFGASIQGAAIAGATWMLAVGRFIAGLGYGMFFMAGPVYIAEISPANVRGRLSSLVGPFVALGILTGYITNFGLANIESGWRISRLLTCLLGCVYIGGVTFLPNSPSCLREERVTSYIRQRFDWLIDSHTCTS